MESGVCYQLVRENVGAPRHVGAAMDCPIDRMETMASSELTQEEAQIVARSEELVDRFLDAIWMERGLSQNTLGAYRADLMTLSRSLAADGKDLIACNGNGAVPVPLAVHRVDSATAQHDIGAQERC